jgi:hypothetical protein
MEPTKGHYSSFVIKIWCDGGGGLVRGHIQHVSTQEYLRFFDLGDMNTFILNHLGASAGDSITPDTVVGRSAVLARDSGGTSDGM